jgi:hypothetical protein
MNRKLYTSLVTSLLLISGCTTYHSAASKGNINAINRLHAEGEDINQLDSSGETALIHAINLNQKEGAIALLKVGADVNACDDILKNTPLHYAILQGNVFFVRFLLENGADVSLHNRDGKSPVDFVDQSHNEEIKRLVKSHNKIPEVVDKKDLKVKDVKVIAAVKSEPVQVVEPLITTTVIEKKLPTISESEARAVLKRLMSKHETLAIRTFLNEHPEAIIFMDDPRQQLRYVGPSGWRIMDIAEVVTRGVAKENDIINHIQTSSLPYKKFTEDEIRIISHYGISIKIINAMISVSD